MAFLRPSTRLLRAAWHQYSDHLPVVSFQHFPFSRLSVHLSNTEKQHGHLGSLKKRSKGDNARKRAAGSAEKHGQKDNEYSNLGALCRAFKDAATRGDENKAQNLLERYHALGGEKQLWMFDMLINMHARKRNLADALAVRDLMHELGLKGSTHVYSSLLVACAHSRGTGYNLPPSTVAAAEQLLEEMQAHGIPRDFTVLSISLDVYAKAGMLAHVQRVLEEMEACGMRPGVREYTSLLDACKRAAQPALAAHVMYHTLPAAQLVPDTQAWNALLGAYGRNGDMDSAYATWQEMMRRRVLPSDVTERELAEAFCSSPGFAADVVEQCRRFRRVLEAADAHTTTVRGDSAQPAEGTSATSSALLINAFHLGGWLNWVRTGLHYPTATPTAPLPAPPAAATPRSGIAAENDATEQVQTNSSTAASSDDGVLKDSRVSDAITSRHVNLASSHVPAAASPGSQGTQVHDEHASAKTAQVSTDEQARLRNSEISTHDAAATHVPPDELNVHRMNASQTRIAVLQRLAALAAAVPRSVLEATKECQNMGEMMLTKTPYATKQSSNASLQSSEDTEASRTFADSEATNMPPSHAQAHQDRLQPHADDHAHDVSLEEGSRSGSGHVQDMHSTPSSQAAGDETRLHNINLPVEGGGLQVVVGRGRHGMTGVTGKTRGLDSNALRKVVEEVCRSVEVTCHEVPGNPGRLHIPESEILRFAARSDFHGERHALLSRVVFRTTLLGVAALGLLASLGDPTWLRWLEFVRDEFSWFPAG